MGFFKKLKERLFTLNVDQTSSKKKVSKQKQDKPETKQNISRSSLASKESLLDKKLERKRLKERRKERKLNKYIAGLSKSGSSFSAQIKEMRTRHHKVDEEFFEDLEEILIMSDISLKLVTDIIYEIKKEVRVQQISDPKLVEEIVVDKIFTVYTNKSLVNTTLNIEKGRLNVILVVGVNGSGKTTTIAKLAKQLMDEGNSVLLAAADTFRAGAVEQLSVWASRVGAELIKSNQEGADPASVVYDSLQRAKDIKADCLIIDTAGRLQNKVNLMQELSKINKIISREVEEAPHESLLVVDATTGQNGVSQAMHFRDVAHLTGIVLTKLDGTSKGGIVLTIKDSLELPVKLIGLGEKIDDLQEFDLDAFIYGLTKELISESA